MSANDNVCHFEGNRLDQLYLVISIDGSPAEKVQVWGYTTCSDRGFTDAERIHSTNAFYYINTKLGDEIRIKQVEKRVYIYSFLYSIDLKATEVDSCTLSSKPCSCLILGDGQTHHFGVDSSFPPAQIFLNCSYLETSVQ